MKHHDRSQIRRSVRSMLWGSTLAMILSCALFAGATHAWFTVRYSAQITVTSANFDVNVVIKKGDNTISPQDGVYSLSTGSYTVTLTRAGSATGTVGYCAITVGDDVYYSQNLSAQPEGVSFTLTIAGDNVPVTFTPVWRDVTKVEGVDPIDSGKTISYSAGSGLFAMGAEPVETVPSEPEGTPEPETEEKNNSEEVPSGTDSGSSGTGKTDDEGGSPVDVPLTPGANESANVNANDNALEDQ